MERRGIDMAEREFRVAAKLRIRTVAEKDANDLQTYCFSNKRLEELSTEIKEDLQKIKTREVHRFVVEASGHAIANIRLERSKRNGAVGEISQLAVAPPFRNFGLADKLVEAVEKMARGEQIRTLKIELPKSASAIIEAYKKWGFAEPPVVTLEKSVKKSAAQLQTAQTSQESDEEVAADLSRVQPREEKSTPKATQTARARGRRREKTLDDIAPNFRTPEEDFAPEEIHKLESNMVRGTLHKEFRDLSHNDISGAAKTIAKSHGIYLEFDRAKHLDTKEEDWMYMIRMSIRGGGPLSREAWAILDDLSERYTVNPYVEKPSLRVTNRQNIQFHWVKKENLIELVQGVAETGFYTMNGCGDNTRNVMGCPVSLFSDVFNVNALAHQFGAYFQIPASAHIEIFAIDPGKVRDPEGVEMPSERFQYGANLLNRKFKIGFSAIHFNEETGEFVPDNCVELRTNDVGVAPLLENGKVERFQVYIGGGQGERNGHVTFSALGVPFGVFTREQLLKGVDAIVRVHQDWGDRQNRHWSRLKYVVYKQGVDWYRKQVRELLDFDFDPPDENHDYGARHLHHGWMKQPSNGLLAYGAFIENGRIIDGPNGRLKTMTRYLMDNYPIRLMTTPNQDVIFIDIPPDAKEQFEADMKRFGYGLRNGKPYSQLRMHSGACVGRDTCALTYTDSEKFIPFLIDELDEKWGDMAESIGVTGCERQCFRPATKTIGWVGMGLDRYKLKLGGTEDARRQGEPLYDPDDWNQIYLRSTPREGVATVTDALFEFYAANRLPDEKMGDFFHRVGNNAVVEYLKSNPRTAKLMEKPFRRF
jgi:sulfite reductase (NADPH) hemoprotein beta-component